MSDSKKEDESKEMSYYLKSYFWQYNQRDPNAEEKKEASWISCQES